MGAGVGSARFQISSPAATLFLLQCIEKLCRYFDIEPREVPISKESHYCLDVKKAVEKIDENTIGVFAILGSTYTGHYEPVEELSKALDDLQARTGLDVPIHVDGASGAFVAPFAHPNLVWDFKLPRVVSINTSGHKYGMVLAGLGWVVFRSPDVLPRELVFELHYLGSVEYSFGLNFSRPAAPVLAQYFNFLNLGFKGYQSIMQENLKNARLFSRALELSGYYDVLSDIHRPSSTLRSITDKAGVTDEMDAEAYMPGLPVVSFRWTDAFKKEYPRLEQKWMQTLLRAKGWIVPNYGLAPPMSSTEILRVVIREDFSEDMADQLIHDILSITEDLTSNSAASHLAQLSSSSDGQTIQSAAASSHRNARHANLSKQLHRPPPGRGDRGQGYAKQC